MNIIMIIHPIKFLKGIFIRIITRILMMKFSKNIEYIGPITINRKIYNWIAPEEDDHWGYIEVFGNLWIYS